MPPVPRELNATVPSARAFVRSLNVLLKYARLYSLGHTRAADQFDATWHELREAVKSAGQAGFLLGTSGSQLLLDGVPLECTPAERSFADLLSGAGVASICFTSTVDRDEFTNFVKAFMEPSSKISTLSERLEQYFGGKIATGIRVNEIRFVAEDAGFSEARVAAQLTVKTLGADAERMQDWFRSPEKMIQLIAAAEGSHGGPRGPGVGSGPGVGGGPGGGGGALESAASGGGTGAWHGQASGGGTGTGPGIGSGSGCGSGTGSGAGLGTGSGYGTGVGGGTGSGGGTGVGAGTGSGTGGGMGMGSGPGGGVAVGTPGGSTRKYSTRMLGSA